VLNAAYAITGIHSLTSMLHS